MLFCSLVRRVEIALERRRNSSVDIVDARSQDIEHFTGGNFPATQQRLEIGDIGRRQFFSRHSTTFVTMKRPFAWRGALLSASSAVNQSRGSSSRKTLKIGIACAAASTSLTSTPRSLSA